MNENLELTPEANEMEKRLWDFIDGSASPVEKNTIEELIRVNNEWKHKYSELLEVHQLLQSSELDQPSLRFTKNVMEEIALYKIAPATKTYINKKVIWGIGTFFILLIVGFLIYGFGQIDWSSGTDSTQFIDFSKIDLSKVDFSKIFNNTYVNIFMMLNIVLGLMLLDRFLANKRREYQK